MAKWDSEKIEKAIEEAEAKDLVPPVPVSTPRKLSPQDTLRRYDRG